MNTGMREVVECALCDADVMPDGERGYVLDEHKVVCFECAVRLGGIYDDARGSWTALPDLTNLRGQPLQAPGIFRRRYRACPRHCAPAAGTMECP